MFWIICGLHNLKRELRRYLLLIVELAVAAAFACICSNIMFSYRNFVKWNEELPAAELTEIAVTGEISDRLAITPEDYYFFKQEYGQQTDFQIIYCIEHLENFYDHKEQVVKTVPILYVSDDYVSHMLQSEKSLSSGAMSEELRAFLSGDGIIPMGGYEARELLSIAPENMKDLEMKTVFYTRFTSYGTSEKETFPYQDCILIPLSVYSERKNSIESAFLYLTAERELLYQKYGEILDYLFYKEENQNISTGEVYYYYTFANQMQGLEQANELTIGKYKMIIHYMIIGIGIIFINMCGILMLTISRRREEYALQLVVGAGRGQIYAGMIFEIGIVVLIGLLVGAVVGSFILGNEFLTVGFPVQKYVFAYVLLGLSGILLVLISSIPFAFSLCRLEPTELLQ